MARAIGQAQVFGELNGQLWDRLTFDIKQCAGQHTGPACYFAGSMAIQMRGKNVAMAFEVLRAPIDFLRPVKPLEAGDLFRVWFLGLCRIKNPEESFGSLTRIKIAQSDFDQFGHKRLMRELMDTEWI